MITCQQGDIFNSGAQALVNPVNCLGTMGKGLASQFKQRYPATEADYRRLCRRRLIRPGTVHIHPPEAGKTIISFPTKDDWRRPSKLEWIVDGLHDLRAKAEAARLSGVAIPALGAGLGGLPWPWVEQAIAEALAESTVEFEVYPPRR